jgi:methionyl-tRNA synthetase
MKNFYITTPIYYVNDKPHIGHAYTTIAADVIARFKRMDGFNVRFLTGTDEHGKKISVSAEVAGIPPKKFVDMVSQNFKDLMPLLSITNDQFIRTTDKYHIEAAQAIWNRLIERDEIYLGSYAGWYSIRDEAYYAESELVEGKAPTGAEVEWLEEPSYFFRLSKWQDKLLKFYEEHPDFIAPRGRRNEIVSFVESGLTDLSVSRVAFEWGVPIPNDLKHVMYVWLDALTNYLTGVGFPKDSEDFKQFWPADVHLVGKDIARFHAVYWPAFLMAADLQPPKRVFAHGWWTNNGEKISKSLGNTIDPIELVNEYGADALRYTLLREVSFGQDGDFSITSLHNRINADLANAYGNLVQRVFSFVVKHCDGVLSKPSNFLSQDQKLLDSIEVCLSEVRTEIDHQALHKVCDSIWARIYEANSYVDAEKPWSLRESNPDRMRTILYVLCEVIRKLALLTMPILPTSSEKILEFLGLKDDSFQGFSEESTCIKVQNPYPLFAKVVNEEK